LDPFSVLPELHATSQAESAVQASNPAADFFVGVMGAA